MTQTLSTIGYEGRTLDDFIQTLKDAGIEIIIDVRDLPLSRKEGFSKHALAAALAGAGIEYVHLRQLGNPQEGRLAARAGKWKEFLRIYQQRLNTQAAQEQMAGLIELARRKPSCLLCFEHKVNECHRQIIAVEAAKRAGFTIRNL
ncbi:MAG: DUF488 family protein [Dongiaceae bacterium]